MSPEPSFLGMLHPFSPLAEGEIRLCATALRGSYPPSADIQFKAITLYEPTKASMVSWLEGGGERPPRKGYICYYIRNTDKFFEAVVLLRDQTNAVLESNVRIKEGSHGAADFTEVLKVEKLVLEDDGVQAVLAKLELPEGTVVVSDPWIYGLVPNLCCLGIIIANLFRLGSDGLSDARRQFQCFLYIQDPEGQNPDSNHYAFPLPVSPVVDVQTMTVTRIENLPTGAGYKVSPPRPYKVPPPAEYVPECQPSLRADLKPLQVVQPEGVSFRVSEEVSGGAVLDWQKWRFRIGFNHREGVVLYNVKYDQRSLFWRVSLSDMIIPYADPRAPYHKKAAFDLGDAVSLFVEILVHSLSLGSWSPPLTR